MHKAVVIANPRGGRSRRKLDFTEVVVRLQQRGMAASLAETTHAGHATDIARRAMAEGVELVVVCGGDGTVREVTEGIMGSDATMLPLATGTTNVVAAGLGLRRDPFSIIDQLDALEVRTIDVGLCGNRPFLMQASAGIDAMVMTEVRQEMKQRFGMLAVATTGLRSWLRYGFPEIRVSVDGVEHRCRGAIVTSFPFYAGLFRLSPHARADDGQMEILLFTGRGRAAAAGFAVDLALGRHLQRRDVKIFNVTRMQFLVPDNLPLQIDGEGFWPTWPVEVSLSPLRLRILCSPDAPLFR